MKRSFSYLLIFTLLLVSFVGHSGFAANVQAASSSVYKKNVKSPHTEYKLTQGVLHTAALQLVQKTGSTGLPAAHVMENSKLPFTSGTTSAYIFPLVKKYLFFIYPSHHFW